VPHRRPSGWASVLALAATALAFSSCSTAASSTTTGSGSVPTGSGIAPLAFLHVVQPGHSGLGSDAGPGGTATAYLADPHGRQVLLHGVDVVGIQDNFYAGGDGKPALYPYDASAYDGRCPSDSSREDEFPVCEVDASSGPWVSTAPGSSNDVAQMRQLGFDVTRLAVSWSLLEPTPGRYSTTYIDRIAQYASWARQQGIYVILDMHQDQYSRYVLPAKGEALPAGCPRSTGNDGAPAWAVFTAGKPACALLGESALNPASAAATQAFFQNETVPGSQGQSPGRGLEDHYIGALASLATRFSNDPTVVGYEIMNEPPVGSEAALPLADLYTTSSAQLYPFYTRVIEALTGVRDGRPTCPVDQPTSLSGSCAYPALAHVDRQSMFYEPLGFRNLFDFSPQVSAPFTSYPNLVYAPHIYTHVFTADASFLGIPPGTSPYPPTYDFGYATALSEAQAMRSAVFVTEFGNPPSEDSTVLAGMTQAQQVALVGGSLWAWSGNTTDKTLGSCWAVYCRYVGRSDLPGHIPTATETLLASRVTYLSRVTPELTAGTLLSYSDDPTTGSFSMVASDPVPVTRGDRSAETVVAVPPRVHGPVAVAGRAVLDTVVTRPDGSRMVYVAPTRSPTGSASSDLPSDRYEIAVGSPPSSVTTKATQQAAAPLQPIAEPEARAQLESALATLATSGSDAVRGKVAGASTLLGILFGTGPDPNGPG
jgi:endoglycosylceramidase